MTILDRGTKAVRALAFAAAALVIGTQAADAWDHSPGGRAANAPPVMSPAPYTAMRPIYPGRRNAMMARPLYLSGYAGYNYTRATSGLTETAFDGRYYRDFPPHFGGRGR